MWKLVCVCVCVFIILGIAKHQTKKQFGQTKYFIVSWELEGESSNSYELPFLFSQLTTGIRSSVSREDGEHFFKFFILRGILSG